MNINETIRIFGQVMPGIWEHMLPEDCQWMKFPVESIADCNNCHMVAKAVFRPQTKCCTYYPFVSNFQIGLGLQSKPHREKMLNALNKNLVTPEGSLIPPRLWIQSIDQGEKFGFGKTDNIVCSFFDKTKNQCGIYPFRNSVCSTFFCESIDGDLGSELWEKLQDFVGQVEMALSQWALDQIGFNTKEYMEKLNHYGEEFEELAKYDAWPPHVVDDLFGDWSSNKEELFVECSKQITANLSNLFEIANQQEILQPTKYEYAKSNVLSDKNKKYLTNDEIAVGQAESIDNLWYTFKTFHRNFNYNKCNFSTKQT